MAKVAIIGAGSIVFCQTLILDILGTPGLQDTEFALMAPSTTRTSQIETFVSRVIKENGLPAKVWITTDRREALKGAKYVISTFQVGGVSAFEADYKLPLKHGVDQCIGDTMGPGGIFRALRSIPVTIDMANDMKELCPDALVLNYVNPMAMICWALGTTGVQFVGLCHGVQTTLDLISGYVGVPKTEIDYLCAGINHMGWFLKIEHKGEDLYPLLRARFEQPEYYVNEKVRGEAFRHFGYFMTESTGHLSEYLPYFRKNQKALDLYCDEPGFGGETGAYYNWCKYVGGEVRRPADPRRPADRPAPAQRRVRLVHHRGAGDRPHVQAERQRHQRGHDQQPAGRLLRRVPGLRGPHRPAQDLRGQPAVAVRRAEHDQRQRPAADRRGRADRRHRRRSSRRARSTRSPRPC